MRVFGSSFRHILQNSLAGRGLRAFKRAVSRLPQTLKKLLSIRHRLLPEHNLHTRSVHKHPATTPIFNKSNRENVLDNIYVEKQVGEQQTCGTHSANVFLAGMCLILTMCIRQNL